MVVAVGIIGAGFIGDRFGTKMHNHPNLTIKTVLDLDEDRAKLLAKKFDAKATTNLHDILTDGEIKIVYIGTPPKFHSNYVIKALNAGIHVICEKPITTDFSEVEKMIEARNRSGKLTAINIPFRFNAGFHKMKEMLDNNEFGDILGLEIELKFPIWPRSWQKVDWLKYKEQGGALREVGTHYIFGLTELFGNIRSVKANTIYPNDDECEINSNAILEMENGLICNLNLITGVPGSEINTFTIYGEKKIARHKRWGLLFIEEDGKSTQVDLDQINSEEQLVDQFSMAVIGYKDGFKSLVSFETAGHVQEILEKILRSQ